MKNYYLIAGGFGLGLAAACLISANKDNLTIDPANRKKQYYTTAVYTALIGGAFLLASRHE